MQTPAVFDAPHSSRRARRRSTLSSLGHFGRRPCFDGRAVARPPARTRLSALRLDLQHERRRRRQRQFRRQTITIIRCRKIIRVYNRLWKYDEHTRARAHPHTHAHFNISYIYIRLDYVRVYIYIYTQIRIIHVYDVLRHEIT